LENRTANDFDLMVIEEEEGVDDMETEGELVIM